MRSLRAWVLTAISPLLIMVPTLAHSQTLSAMWDPNPPSDAVTGYEICIGTTSMSCNFQSATVPASETSYTFAPSPGVLYYVAVRSINAAGPGPFSTVVKVSIPGLTQPANQSSKMNVAISPLSLSASDPDGGTIQFTHSGLPFGLTLNQSAGIITGTPTSPGTSNVNIFVSDGSVTTSRSFGWTVTTGSGDDTTAPTLAITSHTAGQTVSSSSITLAGTATDSGVGGNGITSVAVNGTAAMGGAATGSNTANWSRAVTLAAGANTFTIVATDGAGNARTAAITITRPVAPVTSVALTTSLASPRATGTAITFAAAGSGGVGPLQYKFFVQQGGGLAQVVRDWSTTATYTWTPTTAASYTVIVWARSAGVTTDAAQAFAQTNYIITGAVAATAITPNLPSPRNLGTTVTFTAASTGGTTPHSYKWWVFSGGTWTLARDWSTSPTFSWTPSAPGSYYIGIWVRGANTTADTGTVNFSIPYVITSPPAGPLVATGISADLASPRTVGTTVTFTAGASGGTAPYQFKWWVFANGVWTVAKEWSTNASLTWQPRSSGTYVVAAWVRNAGVTADASQAGAQVNYVVSQPAGAPAPLSIRSLTSTLASPQPANTSIGFTTAATGGTGPYQFKWWVLDGNGWWVVQEWSTSASLNWRPTKAGTYMVAVWGRNAGVTADASQALAQVNYVVSQPAGAPAPLSITSLTSTLASPQPASTSIGFTATATGGSGPGLYQFKWWVFDGTAWWIVQEWSTSASLNWRPTKAGTYIVAVWGRDAGVRADASQALAQVRYSIGLVASLSSTLSSPQRSGTSITFTATAAAGRAPYQYKWWVFDGTSWSVAQNWSTSATLNWRPTRGGTYFVAVWVRNAGSSADASEALAQVPFGVY